MTPNFNLLYVADVDRSSQFYNQLFGTNPVEQSPGFALYVLPGGLKFGLWKKDNVEPAATPAGGFELGLPVQSDADVDRIASEWQERGIVILQTPTTMDFGRTFTAADPDGHRLRVFSPADQP
jgi:predicted enzyme related to lactoylglutathione lyase